MRMVAMPATACWPQSASRPPRSRRDTRASARRRPPGGAMGAPRERLRSTDAELARDLLVPSAARRGRHQRRGPAGVGDLGGVVSDAAHRPRSGGSSPDQVAPANATMPVGAARALPADERAGRAKSLLSAQLAAIRLDVLAGFVSDGAYVQASGTASAKRQRLRHDRRDPRRGGRSLGGPRVDGQQRRRPRHSAGPEGHPGPRREQRRLRRGEPRRLPGTGLPGAVGPFAWSRR